MVSLGELPTSGREEPMTLLPLHQRPCQIPFFYGPAEQCSVYPSLSPTAHSACFGDRNAAREELILETLSAEDLLEQTL